MDDYNELLRLHRELIDENEELKKKLIAAHAESYELRKELEKIRAYLEGRATETNLFDVVEEHANCHVQVLKNSITGETSVGWWEEKE